MATTLLRKTWDLLRWRCPRCGGGRIYERGRMNERCPGCGLLFDREPGYFLGAMYVSYGLASAILLLGLLAAHLLLPEWDPGVLVLIVGALFLPLAPAVTRSARVIGIHFDRWAWPKQHGQAD